MYRRFTKLIFHIAPVILDTRYLLLYSYGEYYSFFLSLFQRLLITTKLPSSLHDFPVLPNAPLPPTNPCQL